MRFMAIVKADERSEAGVMPTEQELTAMGEYNEEPRPESGEFVIELRQVFEAEDFGEEFTPELRAQEDRLRAEMEKNA